LLHGFQGQSTLRTKTASASKSRQLTLAAAYAIKTDMCKAYTANNSFEWSERQYHYQSIAETTSAMQCRKMDRALNSCTKRLLRHAFIALGSNVDSAWVSSGSALSFGLSALRGYGIEVIDVSDVYVSKAIGGGRQPVYQNAVARVAAHMAPAALLRVLKRIERRAGRRLGRHWGPRVLDLDIVSAGANYGSTVSGRRVAGRLILPHPEMHRRAFVLLPLAEIAPHWRHSRLGSSVTQLLQQPSVKRQTIGVVRRPGSAASLRD
jgi:2-amino-4-hydroxy-6-hydroxymethyldihydropteridine diphosphokinase